MAEDDRAAAELWSMAHLGTPMAIRVAATLRIADLIADRPRTVVELAEAADAHADALDRLMRYLRKRGVFDRDGAGRYTLNRLSDLLRDDHPAGMRLGLDIERVGRADIAFVQLLHSVRTGEAAFGLQFGRSFWDDLATDPERKAHFDTWMGSDVSERSEELFAVYDWASLEHVVDVGGGDGSVLAALLTKHPDLRGTIVDLPGTADAARRAITDAGLTDRAEVVSGSFFDPLPAGAGAYLLSLVIHNWADDPARAILSRCAQAVRPGGSVFIVEKIGPAGKAPHSGMDLRMLVLYGGKERGISELTALAADAGLGLVAVHPAGEFSLIELTPGIAGKTPAHER